MSTFFAREVKEERPNYYNQESHSANTAKDVEEAVTRLLGYLADLIEDNCDTHKRAEEVMQDITTDIFLPAIKTAYQDSISYLLWGRTSYNPRNRLNRNYVGTGVDREYQYSEDEEETEDED